MKEDVSYKDHHKRNCLGIWNWTRKQGPVILMLMMGAAVSAEPNFWGVSDLLHGLSELAFVAFQISNSC